MNLAELLVVFVISLLLWSRLCNADLTKLCRDAQCRHPISVARALRAHRSHNGRLLSFNAADTVIVYAKHQEPNQEIWEGEVSGDGQMGYFPRGMVEETTVYEPNPQYSVPTQPGQIKQRTSTPDPEQASSERVMTGEANDKHAQDTDSNSRNSAESLTQQAVPDPVTQWRQEQSSDSGHIKDTQPLSSDEVGNAILDTQDQSRGVASDEYEGRMQEDTSVETNKNEIADIQEQLVAARKRVQILLESRENKGEDIQLGEELDGRNIEELIADARKRVKELVQRLQEEEEEYASEMYDGLSLIHI